MKVRWILPNQLAVGRCVRPGEEAILAEARIHSVLALCDESEAQTPFRVQENFHVMRHPLPDSHKAYPLIPKDVMSTLNILHHNIVHNRPTYVHCLAGMERSPTICIAYLCVFKGYGLWESFNWVKQVNPRTCPTEAQLDVVRWLINQQQEMPSLSPYVPPVLKTPGLVS
ncbi:MAG: dual specificity protein phosphatase [Cyanobacteria bacterium P01_F01_bin.150]